MTRKNKKSSRSNQSQLASLLGTLVIVAVVVLWWFDDSISPPNGPVNPYQPVNYQPVNPYQVVTPPATSAVPSQPEMAVSSTLPSNSSMTPVEPVSSPLNADALQSATQTKSRIETPTEAELPAGIDPTGTSLAMAAPSSGAVQPAIRPVVDPTKLQASDPDGLKLIAGFDCSPKNVVVTATGPAQFEVRFPSGRDNTGFFLFRLEHANGKEVSITLTNVPEKWKTLNPVYCHSIDLSELKNFESHPPEKTAKPVKAPNGPLLPDTTGEQWHFIENVTYEKGRLTLIHNYETDAVSIAMRPPYTPAYGANYADSLRGREHVIVHDIGITPEGRPLQVIQIGGEDEKSLREKPCLLIYAREHADEHDGSWVAQGAIEAMLLDNPLGQKLRRQINLLVIPLYDPDGAANARYHRITNGYGPGIHVPEAERYMVFFINWFNAENRVDLVIDLHNVESSEAPHLSFGSFPKQTEIKAKAMHYLHTLVQAQMEGAGYGCPKGNWGGNNYVFRFTSIFEYQFGATWILYEANSQAPKRHLTTAQLRIMGALLTETTAKYLRSQEFRPLMLHTQNIRDERLRRWLCWHPGLELDQNLSPYDLERKIWAKGTPEQHKGSPEYLKYQELLKSKYPSLEHKETSFSTPRN